MKRTCVALRIVAFVALIALCLTGQTKKFAYTSRDKAFFADPALVNFVRPGLVITINSAQITSIGVITMTYTLTDPFGLPLDATGVTTPGAVSLLYEASYIPKGQEQYVAYTTVQATGKVLGTITRPFWEGPLLGGPAATQVGPGQYQYIFQAKAPAGFDATATTTVGLAGNRDLTSFNLGTSYAGATFNFVPNGSPVKVTRDVIRTQSCNGCHDQLTFHGGYAHGMEMCVLCHQPQNADPGTGNSLDLKVMAHKIHMGSQLPSVKAGTPYQIIGFRQHISDWSDVVFPANPRDPRNCEACHQQNTGAKQATAYLTPNRAACGACHDDVNFATGENHVNLPQVSDNQCASCHTPQGELEFDASIKGAHTNPTQSATLPGLVISILKVNNGTAGSKPAITFTLQDSGGNPIAANSLVGGANRLAAVLAGPTTDYGYTDFGPPTVTTGGYVSENATTATCSTDGTCVYQFVHAIPANATGTFSIGMEGRRGATLLAGTTKEMATEYGAVNKVVDFSVDGSPVQHRRQVVDIAKCNACHVSLSVHGENRNQIEMCVLCHNASETDQARRPLATNAADKGAPPQSVDFAVLIHKIHTGAALNAIGQPFVVVGFGGSHNDFSEVTFPAFSPAGAVGNVQNCSMCHVNGSEQNLPVGLNDVKTPNGLLNPTPATTAACTACHAEKAVLSHAVANTTQFGESCTACHGPDDAFSPDKVHAQ